MSAVSLTQEEHFAFLKQVCEQIIPFNKHLGLKVEVLEKGYSVIRLPWQDHMIGDPLRRIVHGGILSTLIDVSGGMACFSAFSDVNDRLSTVDLRVDYLQPGPAADFLCESRVIRMGNRVAVARSEVYSRYVVNPDTGERGKPVAFGLGVYNVVRGSDKRGPETPSEVPIA